MWNQRQNWITGQFSPPVCEGSQGNTLLQTHLPLAFLSTAGIILAIKLSLLMRLITFNPARYRAQVVLLIRFWHACFSQHSPPCDGSRGAPGAPGTGSMVDEWLTPHLSEWSQTHNQLTVVWDRGETGKGSGLTKSIVEISSLQKILHSCTSLGLKVQESGIPFVAYLQAPQTLPCLLGWVFSVWGGNGKPLKPSISSISLPRHGQIHGLVYSQASVWGLGAFQKGVITESRNDLGWKGP